MSTDRELLELAARAAGIAVEWHDGCGEALALVNPPPGWGLYWNPLNDDGDALRLATSLNLQPRQGGHLVSVLRPDGGWDDENYRDHGDDKYAATRRAIVRAAAAIGAAMKPT